MSRWPNGAQVPLDTARLALIIDEACAGLEGVERRAGAHRNPAQSL